MTMPNLFIVGAQKSGTTSLYRYLAQHPQVYMSPVKEPLFFNHPLSSGGEVLNESFGHPIGLPPVKFANIEQYRTLFERVADEVAVGEASTLYISVSGTAERIKRHVPEAKIIAILRNPADRAYSSFLHARRIGVEPLTDFARALRDEEDRVRNNWPHVYRYRSRGLYYAQLAPYYELFGYERVGVWLYEDLKNRPADVARSVFGFLGVDRAFVPDTSSKHNPAGLPKNRVSRAVIKAMDTTVPSMLRRVVAPTSDVYAFASRARERTQAWFLTRPPSIDQEIRDELLEGYKDDVLRLQDLIGRDLSSWLGDGTGREIVSSKVPYGADDRSGVPGT